MKRWLKPLFETSFVFGLLGWLYVIITSWVHNAWIYDPLTHWFPLRTDYFGEICFVIAAISFFMWRYLCESSSS